MLDLQHLQISLMLGVNTLRPLYLRKWKPYTRPLPFIHHSSLGTNPGGSKNEGKLAKDMFFWLFTNCNKIVSLYHVNFLPIKNLRLVYSSGTIRFVEKISILLFVIGHIAHLLAYLKLRYNTPFTI